MKLILISLDMCVIEHLRTEGNVNRVSQYKMLRNQSTTKEKMNEFVSARGQDLHVQVVSHEEHTQKYEVWFKGW